MHDVPSVLQVARQMKELLCKRAYLLQDTYRTTGVLVHYTSQIGTAWCARFSEELLYEVLVGAPIPICKTFTGAATVTTKINGHTMLFERYCGCNSVHVGHVRPFIALGPP